MPTMSNVCGALYVTVAPMSFAARSTPFLTTDQNASDACPWVTTAMRTSARGAAPPAGAAEPAGAAPGEPP
jgi:hypothetical protein